MNNEWKMVPVAPTDEMEVAAENDYEQTGATFPRWKSAYAAMLAAAPSPPASAQDDAKEYGSPADVAQRIEQYLSHDGRKNSATQLLYEAMKALRAVNVPDIHRLQAMAAEWDRARRGVDSHMPIWSALCEALGKDRDGAGMRAAMDAAIAQQSVRKGE